MNRQRKKKLREKKKKVKCAVCGCFVSRADVQFLTMTKTILDPTDNAFKTVISPSAVCKWCKKREEQKPMMFRGTNI